MPTSSRERGAPEKTSDAKPSTRTPSRSDFDPHRSPQAAERKSARPQATRSEGGQTRGDGSNN
jgi:hypothetical protein